MPHVVTQDDREDRLRHVLEELHLHANPAPLPLERLRMRSPRSSSVHALSTRASRGRARPWTTGPGRWPKLTSNSGARRNRAHRSRAPCPSRAGARDRETLDRAHVVGHEHDRLAGLAQAAELVVALALERGVADGQHLVDQQDVGSTWTATEKPRRTYMPDE